MNRAMDGHVAFFTLLKLITKQGTKSITVKFDLKFDPGVQANTTTPQPVPMNFPIE